MQLFKQSSFEDLNSANIWSNIISGVGDGVSSYLNTKAENYYETAKLYNQSIPLYQQIGAQVREQMMEQANQYMNAGVDVSQGTAFKVVSHTQEQGTMKLNEIRTNLDIQTTNMRKMASSQATMGLVNGIMSGITGATDSYLSFIKAAGGQTATGGNNATITK